MARGVALENLIAQLRSELRDSSVPSLGQQVRHTLVQTVQRVQETLYDDYDWSFLNVREDKLTQAGQRYYDIPTAMTLEGIREVWSQNATSGGTWGKIPYGIDQTDLNALDSDINTNRRDPIAKWQVINTGSGEQIEVWPIPATNNLKLRFIGKKKLAPLVADSDRAELDDKMIVLFAAGEILGAREAADAGLKLGKANERYNRLKARTSTGATKVFVLGGPSPADTKHLNAVWTDT